MVGRSGPVVEITDPAISPDRVERRKEAARQKDTGGRESSFLAANVAQANLGKP